MSLCSSSSPEQRVGKVGKSPAAPGRVLVAVPTRRLRGSQKLKSVVDTIGCGIGEGEGERDGQDSMERRSEAWLAVTEGG